MPARRSLLYVPVVHSPADMGSLAGRAPLPAGYARVVETYWEAVDRELRAVRPTWDGVRCYQDGLPDTRPDIVGRIVAEVDSPNYRLLRWLVAHGAEVVGTEDPVLLQEEYELLMATVDDPSQRAAYAARAPALLDARDRYIGGCIDRTLPGGGQGVLFIGVSHGRAHLPSDLEVTTLPTCRPFLPPDPRC